MYATAHAITLEPPNLDLVNVLDFVLDLDLVFI